MASMFRWLRASPTPKLKSRWSVPDPKFFNRTAELESLHDLLSPTRVGDPGRIVLLTGPKDSGKSALLREFCSRQCAGVYKGVPAFVDMSNMNPLRLATNLTDNFAESVALKGEKSCVELPRFRSAFEMIIDEDRPRMKKLEDYRYSYSKGIVEPLRKTPIDMFMSAFEAYTSALRDYKSGFYVGFPTIFIDEANALASWTRTPEGAANLESLLCFLVRISSAANVVLASSENFFKEWLSTGTPFSGHNDITVATVGHLSQEEARGFLRERFMDPELDPELLKHRLRSLEEVCDVWDDVYAHCGGAILSLQHFVQLAVQAKPGEVNKKWELEKRQLLKAAKVFVNWGFSPGALALHAEPFGWSTLQRGPPKWTSEEWKVVVKAMADAQDGVVNYFSLPIRQEALASMINYDLLHYRVPSGWDRDINVPGSWTAIVMPVSRAQHLVMKEMLAGWSRATKIN